MAVKSDWLLATRLSCHNLIHVRMWIFSRGEKVSARRAITDVASAARLEGEDPPECAKLDQTPLTK